MFCASGRINLVDTVDICIVRRRNVIENRIGNRVMIFLDAEFLIKSGFKKVPGVRLELTTFRL